MGSSDAVTGNQLWDAYQRMDDLQEGIIHYMRENVLFNLGASLCSDGDVMGRAGISFTVGKDMKRKPMLARDMAGMQQQMIAMQAKVEDLESERKRDKETLARNAETLKKNEEIMKQNEKLIRELTKRLEAKK